MEKKHVRIIDRRPSGDVAADCYTAAASPWGSRVEIVEDPSLRWEELDDSIMSFPSRLN